MGARMCSAREIRRAPDLRHGRDRARDPRGSCSASATWAATATCSLFSRARFADGRLAGRAARPVAARAARALHHRLSRAAASRHAFRRTGRVVDFGVPQAELDATQSAGTPFRTSGCPGKDATMCRRATGPTATRRRATSRASRSSPDGATCRRSGASPRSRSSGAEAVAGRFRVVDTVVREGRFNIAVDQAMIESHQAGGITETFRFMRFPPMALIGCHQALSEEVRMPGPPVTGYRHRAANHGWRGDLPRRRPARLGLSSSSAARWEWSRCPEIARDIGLAVAAGRGASASMRATVRATTSRWTGGR